MRILLLLQANFLYGKCRLTFYMRHWLCSILVCLLFSTCRKDSPVGSSAAETKVSVDYYITNKLPLPVNLGIYATDADYTNDANAVLSIRIKGADSFKWHVTQKYDSFFVDWHTDNYEFSNWGVELPQTVIEFSEPRHFSYRVIGRSFREYGFMPIFDEGYGFAHSIYEVTHLQRIFMNTTGTSTTWQAFDYIDRVKLVSLWNNLTDSEKLNTITFRKNMLCTFQYESMKKTEGNYHFIDTVGKPFIEIELHDDSFRNWSITNRNPFDNSQYYSDTLFYFDKPGKYYALKKVD